MHLCRNSRQVQPDAILAANSSHATGHVSKSSRLNQQQLSSSDYAAIALETKTQQAEMSCTYQFCRIIHTHQTVNHPRTHLCCNGRQVRLKPVLAANSSQAASHVSKCSNSWYKATDPKLHKIKHASCPD
jgi:hypothetical protein